MHNLNYFKHTIMSKTLVLDINELYQVVPETRSLEGKNFKDVRELLKDLIAKVEETGRWQFVQYVNNKPSLFVVREESADEMAVSKLKKKMENMLKQIESKKDAVEAMVPTPHVYKETTPAPEAYSPQDFDDTAEEVGDLNASVPKDKLPWEK